MLAAGLGNIAFADASPLECSEGIGPTHAANGRAFLNLENLADSVFLFAPVANAPHIPKWEYSVHPAFISELERGVAGGNIEQVIAVCREVGIDLFARPRG